ncbi:MULTISPECIES: hypothetical protein [Halorussus]|uniref:hypothetical protein n=1 Tax=Halorussus TaxID=1070314 RepID=UPI00209E35EA|nr:hypothetical protein [Halorussus vallis]USZ76111.1 hypothetical protein NGM07_02010 [Halorussus vallis]
MTGGTHSKTLPRLEPGLTVLERPSRRSTALHRLALHELGERTGETLWVDARNQASTYALHELAPGRRRLDGVRVARAFTAYQHHSLVRAAARRASPSTALVVAPCVASLYRDDDLPDREGRDLLSASLAVLAELASALDLPVVVTAEGADAETAALVADYADAEIECTRTDAGLRYASDDFETTVYLDDGFWQTTIPYWVELLGAVAEDDPVAAATAAGLVAGEV